MKFDQEITWPKSEELAAGESKLIRIRVFLIVVGVFGLALGVLLASAGPELKPWLMYCGLGIGMGLISVVFVAMGMYPSLRRNSKLPAAVRGDSHSARLLRAPAITIIGLRLIGLVLGVSALSTMLLAAIDGDFGELGGRAIAIMIIAIPLSLVILIGTAWNGGRPLWFTADGGILRADLVDGNVRLDISGDRREIIVDLVGGYIVQVRTVDGPVARKFHPTFGRKGGKESVFMINPILYGVDLATVIEALTEGFKLSESCDPDAVGRRGRHEQGGADGTEKRQVAEGDADRDRRDRERRDPR